MDVRNRIVKGGNYMKFAENNNGSIIEEMFKSKSIEFEEYIDKKESDDREVCIVSRLIEELEELVKELEVSEKVKKPLIAKCEEFDRAASRELTFWETKAYKLGFIDGMRMGEDLQTPTSLKKEDE